jgi:ADP-heptose:LPS heptosyltransferase
MNVSVLRLAKQSGKAILYFPLRVLLYLQRRRVQLPPVKRILLLDGSHIGDIVIASSLLPVLRSAFPAAEIGMACGSWAREVLQGHSDVSFIHEIDHWSLNRAPIGYPHKLLRYWISRRKALSEIRARKYDLALALHPSRPDFLEIAWRAGIPIRAAFTRSLWEPLATVTASYEDDDAAFITQGACFEALLRALGIEEKHIRLRHSSLPSSSATAMAEVSALLSGAAPDRTDYIVVHMGSGSRAKELSSGFWRELSLKLAGQTILFTGAGEREKLKIREVAEAIPGAVDACNQLSWSGFVAAVRHAKALFGVDSAAAHVAAAVETPCFSVYSGIAGVGRWRPEGGKAVVWSNPVPCSPCFRKDGCAEMHCMKGITPQNLLQNFADETDRRIPDV